MLPWAVLGVGMLASYLLFSTIRDNVESSASERFDHQTIEAKRVIETHIQSYADVLYSVRALFDTHAPVSRAQFHGFVESLNLKNRFPGIEVVNYAIHVRPQDKGASRKLCVATQVLRRRAILYSRSSPRGAARVSRARIS